MDKITESALKRNFIGSAAGSLGHSKILQKELGSQKFLEHLRVLYESTMVFAVKQRHKCPWAIFDIVRDQSTVTISWIFQHPIKNAKNYSVCCVATEIDLEPKIEALVTGCVIETKGDGKIKLELEEGFSYVFDFSITNLEVINDNTLPRSERIQTVLVYVAIPLSDKSKTLLRAAVKLDLFPEENIRLELKNYLKKKEAFNAMCQEAIEGIKIKRLPPDEELKEIEDFTDYANLMKEKFGI